jgi:hypothetical protein
MPEIATDLTDSLVEPLRALVRKYPELALTFSDSGQVGLCESNPIGPVNIYYPSLTQACLGGEAVLEIVREFYPGPGMSPTQDVIGPRDYLSAREVMTPEIGAQLLVQTIISYLNPVQGGAK